MSGSDTYLTIATRGEGLVREKMSRFLAFAVPADTVEKAQAIIKEYQNKYHDARHVCWAYMLGPKRDVWQLNDNGEPSGTAGKPILGQINSKGLTDVVVVVVRYFGGIKLGTSGLIVAYREAARLALEDAVTEERRVMVPLSFQFGYEAMNGIMKIIKARDLEVAEKNFDNLCTMTLMVGEADLDGVAEMLEKSDALIRYDDKRG